MSILTELSRLQTAKANMKTALESKEVVVPSDARLSDYPALITSIGAKAVEEKFLNFYDFEGTLVASYDADEIAGLTELPEAPDHSADEVPLTFEEWNWTLDEIKEYHTELPDATIIVGATYHPTDGKLHMIVETFVDNYLNPLQLSFQSEAQIDWGDGTSSTASGGSDVSHYYETKGRYHVVVTTTSTYFSITKTANLLPKEAYIPRAITTLNGLLFYKCYTLEKVVLPSSVTLGSSIYGGVFGECYSLGAIILPRSLTEEVSESSMMNCYSLRVLSLPPAITSLEDYAINGCIALRKITIPKGLLALSGSNALSNTAVEEIRLPSSLTSIGFSSFRSDKGLKKINIPAGVREIKSYTFNDCQSLEQIELNEGLETIGGNAFDTARSLQSITIPSTVTSIGSSAFNNAQCLASVTVLATAPPTLGSGAFSGSGLKKIYVPAESVEAYKSATNWANYAEKIEAIPE